MLLPPVRPAYRQPNLTLHQLYIQTARTGSSLFGDAHWTRTAPMKILQDRVTEKQNITRQRLGNATIITWGRALSLRNSQNLPHNGNLVELLVWPLKLEIKCTKSNLVPQKIFLEYTNFSKNNKIKSIIILEIWP